MISSTSNSPDSTENALAAALKLYRSGRHREAFDGFHSLLNRMPPERDILLYMADSARILGRRPEALSLVYRYLSVFPASRAGLQLLLHIQRAIGQVDKCIETMTRLLAIKPDQREIHAFLCRSLIARERLSLAITIFETLSALADAIDKDRREIADTMAEFARLLARLPHYNESERRLLRALERSPACPSALWSGLKHAEAGQHDRAAQCFANAAKETPDWSWVAAHLIWHDHVRVGLGAGADGRFAPLLARCKVASMGRRIDQTDGTISLLCPSRGRPLGLRRSLATASATARRTSHIEFVIYLDDDDPSASQALAEMQDVARSANACSIVVIQGPRCALSKVWNLLGHLSRGQILTLANDDQVFETPSWDDKVATAASKTTDQIYCLWVDDGIVGELHGNFPFVSRRLCHLLGYYFVPEILEFSNNDVWIWDIARRLDRLNYVGDVVIRHDQTWDKKEGDLQDAERKRRMALAGADSLVIYQTWNIRRFEADRLRKHMSPR